MHNVREFVLWQMPIWFNQANVSILPDGRMVYKWNRQQENIYSNHGETAPQFVARLIRHFLRLDDFEARRRGDRVKPKKRVIYVDWQQWKLLTRYEWPARWRWLRKYGYRDRDGNLYKLRENARRLLRLGETDARF